MTQRDRTLKHVKLDERNRGELPLIESLEWLSCDCEFDDFARFHVVGSTNPTELWYWTKQNVCGYIGTIAMGIDL